VRRRNESISTSSRSRSAISVSAAYLAANIDGINAASQVSSIRLTDSGIPRLVKDPAVGNAIIQQITAATALYGLPAPHLNLQHGTAVLSSP